MSQRGENTRRRGCRAGRPVTRSLRAAVLSCAIACVAHAAAPEVHRVTTIVPFPRGLEMVDGQLYVLSRGRVREAGGVTSAIDDKAGFVFHVDPAVVQSAGEHEVAPHIRSNGEVFAAPAEPPFRLWKRNASPPWSDRETDRPYCGLRWHEPTRSFYICAFSGVDKPGAAGGRNFSKNLSDAILRYDTRTSKWYEVERHDIEAGGIYPHKDPWALPPPHGWLNGPDNLLPVGDSLYAVAKDNSVLVRYDLSPLKENPEAGPARGEWIMQGSVATRNAGEVALEGHSALAARGGWLYVATRTSSHVVRLRLDERARPVQPIEVELLALFDPWTAQNPRPANLTDMAFDSKGRLYVVGAQPARVYRFVPDPQDVFDARGAREAPWLDLAGVLGNPGMKSENILIDGTDTLYITSGDGYGFQDGAEGTVYRVGMKD